MGYGVIEFGGGHCELELLVDCSWESEWIVISFRTKTSCDWESTLASITVEFIFSYVGNQFCKFK